MYKIRNCFITGTDTNIGKTYISVGLLKALAKRNYITTGIKPIASGCELYQNEWKNTDALALQAAATLDLPYKLINPFAFAPPIAPHIAAIRVGIMLNINLLMHALQPVLAIPSEINIIEGVGGWWVPLNQHQKISDLAVTLNSAVILVVGIKLGCLNHALLSARAIEQSGLPFVGWFANCVDMNMAENEQQANISTLKDWLSVPCLGEIPFSASAEMHINTELFLQRFTDASIS